MSNIGHRRSIRFNALQTCAFASSPVDEIVGISRDTSPQTCSIMRQTRVYSNADIVEYSKVSHDYNPLHLDPECARNAGFEDCLVHGMLVASLFPRIIAAQFPGTVYAMQSLHFKLPIHVGEEIVGEVEATNIRQIKNKYLVKFSTKCFKNDSLIALDGEATAILPTLSME